MQRNDQKYSGIALICIFDMILNTDDFDTMSTDLRGLYQRFDQVKMNELIQKRNIRGGSRAAATSKMERFVIIVNGFKPLTISTKRSILDVRAALDPPLNILLNFFLS